MSVLLATNYGDIVIDFFVQLAPQNVENFLKLVKMKFFHNTLFHKVERDFLMQGGLSYPDRQPTTVWKEMKSKAVDLKTEVDIDERAAHCTDGFIPDEIVTTLKHECIGLVGCANDYKNTNDSRFYITLRKDIPSLNGKHTIFGVVSEGMEDVVLKLIAPILIDDKTKEPAVPVRILKAIILDDPFPDPRGFHDLGMVPVSSPKVLVEKEIKQIHGIKDEIEIIEELEAKKARGRAVLLEMLGDIPDADVAPPDNVLFVCKLNPDTQQDDLELIFSRFGELKSCEIVKDFKTGQSLQYGFIEYEMRESCEKAYFKMQDVLIDDRRIHVDFCQSINKKGKFMAPPSFVMSEKNKIQDSGDTRERNRGGNERDRERSRERYRKSSRERYRERDSDRGGRHQEKRNNNKDRENDRDRDGNRDGHRGRERDDRKR